MSRAGRGGGVTLRLLLLMALSWIPGSGLSGQETGVSARSPLPSEDSVLSAMRTELDRLITRMDTLRVRANQAERRERMRPLREEQPATDTFLVGPIRVIALPEQRPLGERVMGAAWEEWKSRVGGSEDLLRPWNFLVHHYWSRDEMVVSADSLLERVEMHRRYPERRLRRKASEAVGRVVMGSLPPEIRAWSGERLEISDQRMPWVARELVATPSIAVRRCFLGELEWCAEALGLRGSQGGWERWYTPEERRFYVRERTGASGERAKAIWDGCVWAGMDDACQVFLRDRDPVIPLSSEARSSLLVHALAIGGPGSISRLRASEDGSLFARLAAAAGVPGDSLLASWRRKVLEARPSVWAGLGRSPLPLVFWLVLLGSLAMRSTRWRLG